jgi:hypothetical protein
MKIEDLYLDTLRDTLTGKTYNDTHALPYYPLRRFLNFCFPGLSISRKSAPDSPLLSDRQGWWQTAKTMTGTLRMDNFRFAIENTVGRGIEGDIVETGVWRGGACIYAAGVLKAFGWHRDLWVCDSFAGLPEPKVAEEGGTRWCKLNDFLAVPKEEVMDSFRRFHLLDDKIHFVQGFFEETMPKMPVKKIAVLRCDGDMYQSTMDVLQNLYPRVSDGGVVIIDDWGIPECQKAVKTYLERVPEKPSIIVFGKTNDAAYWFKPATGSKSGNVPAAAAEKAPASAVHS